MNYIFKRAFGMSVLLYVLTFVVGIVCGVTSGQDMSSMTNMPDKFWYVGMVGAVILTGLVTMWYFKNKNLKLSGKNGLLFGVTAAVFAFGLDFILFSFGNTQGANFDMGAYYSDFRFWIIVALVIVTAGCVGQWKSKK